MRKFKLNKTTYNILVFSEMLWSFSTGILGPIYAIFVGDIGGNLVDVGVAYALLLFTSGLLSIPFSKLSDKIGKKKVILLGSFIYLPIPFLYPSVVSTLQIFVLQIWDGISGAIAEPAWEAMVAESTEKKKRGMQYGIRFAVRTISAGIAALIGGLIAQYLGFRYAFYLIGILSIISTILIFLVDDDSSKKTIKI